MKKTNLFIRLIAAVLTVCLTAVLFAGCGASQEIVMTLKKGDKIYTITEEEFDMLMKIKKRVFFCSMYRTSTMDTASFWNAKSSQDAEKTNEQYFKDLVVDQVKAILVEKYLFDEHGLTISQDTLDGYEVSKKAALENKTDIITAGQYSGQGGYKQFYGYTASSYYKIYEPMVTRSEMLLEALTDSKKGTGELAATAEDLKKYYEDHYVGYQCIVIDLQNKLVKDENGNPILNKVKDAEGNEVDGDTYKTEALTADEKSAKQTLPDEILKKLKEGASFESLIEQYSEDYYTREYIEGQFVDKDSTFINTTITDKIKDLKVGEWKDEVLGTSTKKYIIKKVALKPFVYEEFEKDENGNTVTDENGNEVENKYFETFFENFEETVNFNNYEEHVKKFYDDIVLDDGIISKYTMEDTFLSGYVDAYYQMLYYYSGMFGN